MFCPRESKVHFAIFVHLLGVVMMRSTGANRKETVDGIASFTKATQWYTDSIPKDNEGGIFDHCLEWMKVSDAVGIYVSHHA